MNQYSFILVSHCKFLIKKTEEFFLYLFSGQRLSKLTLRNGVLVISEMLVLRSYKVLMLNTQSKFQSFFLTSLNFKRMLDIILKFPL